MREAKVIRYEGQGNGVSRDQNLLRVCPDDSHSRRSGLIAAGFSFEYPLCLQEAVRSACETCDGLLEIAPYSR